MVFQTTESPWPITLSDNYLDNSPVIGFRFTSVLVNALLSLECFTFGIIAYPELNFYSSQDEQAEQKRTRTQTG